MAVFISRTVVNVRNQPSLRGQVVGQVAKGQEVPTEDDPIIADNWVWYAVTDSQRGLWVAERSTDGTRILLDQKAAPAKPDPMAGVTAPLRRDVLPVEIPLNVDLEPRDYERTFRAALGITRAFEEGRFDSYQTYDSGIISYGIVQFTLAAGSLVKVVELYLNKSGSQTAQAIRGEYQARLRAKDPTLRTDTRIRDLLKAAAQEPPMQEAQIEITKADYWEVVLRNYIQRRGNFRLPLSYALLFDMGINFGVNHGFLRLAEEQLGIPPLSRVGTNGVTEEQLMTRLAELRRQSHYRQAERDNLPGLKVRGDFWVNLTQGGDWRLQGDQDGLVYPKRGLSVQVRNPL